MELGPLTLTGRNVRLEPLARSHVDDLMVAAADPLIWRWLPEKITSRADLERWLEDALRAQELGSEYPFAVIDLGSGRAVGSTRYMDVSRSHRGVEVGWTWYGRDAQGTVVNPESKLLLLGHAFERWDAIRLYLKTDSLNERSRAAIAKLGAKYEGDLRNHRIRPDGTYRHSSYYSILDSEWPAVKQGLERRIAQFNPTGGGPRAGFAEDGRDGRRLNPE
ncbi:MAG: GNAT family N-acetyltransferase [Candidatus Dormibacteraeota bacterium]|nr:GNAT family N-acetyltransferase [Candidatus Dormibacteraeota bacterium]